MENLQQTPSAPSAPAAPVQPAAPPPAPNTLAEFRAQKAQSLAALTEPTEPPKPAETPKEPPVFENLEPPLQDEGDDDQPPQAAQPPDQPKGPEAAAHRWKDPDTGMTLDLRRRDHRRMKRLLEERADLARQVAQMRQTPPQAQLEPQARPQPQAIASDPNDPEPQLEQFAEAPDPYGAFVAAQARWHARQEFRQQQAAQTRVERLRRSSAAIEHAQADYDAGLADARQRYPDFDDAHADVLSELGRLPMPARAPLVHRLLTSPLRHDLTHYLGSHPEDLAAVAAARNLHEQGLVLGAIETRVRALVNQRTTPAPQTPTPPPPAPMAPVGGTASPVAMPDGKSMTLAQFRAAKAKLGMTA